MAASLPVYTPLAPPVHTAQPAEPVEPETSTNVTLHFPGYDHTLGAPLRAQLLKDPEVLFAAYKAPHPLQKAVEVRLQTLTTDAKEIAESALAELVSELDEFERSFQDGLA